MKQSSGKNGKFKYVFKVEDVDPQFLIRPFGRQLDEWKKVKQFEKNANIAYVDCKHKDCIKSIKKWIKENKPSQYWAYWEDTDLYKHDCVEIYYVD